MAPVTEFARDFCAGIGPLQLGVMLVSISVKVTIMCLCYFSCKVNVLDTNLIALCRPHRNRHTRHMYLGYPTNVILES